MAEVPAQEDLTNQPLDQNEQACEAGGAMTLTGLTVIQNATQTNVTGAKNWATVKKSSDGVIVEATTAPNTPEAWKKIKWSGDSGAAVSGHDNQRKLSRSAAKKYHVVAELGGTQKDLDVWVIWTNLVVTKGSTDTIDTGNDATGLAAGHKWKAADGGGNKLGPIDCQTTSLTYAYAVGSMQAKATLQPAGIENVVRSHWHMRRKATAKGFDNGVKTADQTDGVDDSDAAWVDVDPKSGTSTREIYDLDQPGCSVALSGTTINHTSETYANFTQYVTVTLDSDYKCSDDVLWSYEARVDVDKTSGKVERNRLRLSHIAWPPSRHYSTK
ncbi:MAG: hypothetical protein GY778_26715 [bacterium]|nr:hypothetical protein [bacterium]